VKQGKSIVKTVILDVRDPEEAMQDFVGLDQDSGHLGSPGA
jgi:hypothetical protein